VRADGLPIDIDIRVLKARKLRNGRLILSIRRRPMKTRRGEPWRAFMPQLSAGGSFSHPNQPTPRLSE
jgi:hypothetical protein